MNLFKGKDQSQLPTNPIPILAVNQREIGSIAKHTLISTEIEVKGVFTGRGNLQVDGMLEGNINIEGAVTVSDGAQITGDITANTVTVAGQVKGNITSKKLEITTTGKVWGDLQVERLLQHEGGFHSGRSDMQVPESTAMPRANTEFSDDISAQQA